MDFTIDERAIERSVINREDEYQINENWYTPSGKTRQTPIYIASILNEYLGEFRDIQGKTEEELEQKADKQIQKWKQKEIRARVVEAKREALDNAESYWEERANEAKAALEDIRGILVSSLSAPSVLDLNSYYDRRQFEAFKFSRKKPTKPSPSKPPQQPKRKLFHVLIPPLWRKRLDTYASAMVVHENREQRRQSEFKNDLVAWQERYDKAKSQYEARRQRFIQAQDEHNRHIQYFIEQYEAGAPEAIKEYLGEVFAKDKLPESFPVESSVSFDSNSLTAVIDLTLPNQDSVSTVIDYKFKKTTRSASPVNIKPKEHDDLYDSAIKQAVLRALNRAFASTKPDDTLAAVVNGWVTYLDKTTGTDKTSCVISVSADRQKFEEINLKRVDPTECVKGLKGLVAGPLSQVAPVQPILQLNREDNRFVESQAVLAEINATTNLAEIGWEEFEHLVRELFGKMFSDQGSEVKVTQASSDGGVDAIAFDPDPIRGGKFVIQAKRYTKVVPVSAVRDLYGTMIAEGASKGLLVTTSHFGKDSREFVKDKPISLIDGSNLVFLLEKHGHKVRIDIKEARGNINRNPLAKTTM